MRRAAALAAATLLLGCHRAPAAPDAPNAFRVRIETTRGPFVVEVRPDWAPRGAARFAQLVRAHYFDDSRVFRVVPGFIAQFGIAGDPRVAQAWRARTFPDDSVRTSNVRGTLAFAMTGPNDRRTQIYVNLADNARLDAQGFAPFARVVQGMAVVDALYGGYGERSGGGVRAGRQDSLFLQGNAYLDRVYPRLDHVVRATVVR